MKLPDGWSQGEWERAEPMLRWFTRRPSSASLHVLVRAPGRVNLIGEHTDYSGLPVLPVAVNRSTIVVARESCDGMVRLRNVNRSYQPRRFRMQRRIEPYAPGDWGNYVKAALQGVIDRFPGEALVRWRMGERGKSLAVGLKMMIDGAVPVAAGLSSSAALTVASTLAFMAVRRIELPPLEVAAMVARSERYVGTMSGGMDQAAAMMGRRGHALFIRFDPLRVEPLPMPRNTALVVAQSREPADKSGRVQNEYNRRVVECALAARLLAQALDLGPVRVLGDIVNRLEKWRADDLIATLGIHAPAEFAPDLRDAARILGVSRPSLTADLLGRGPGRIVLDPDRPLKPLSRARHVISETERVLAAVDALRAARLEDMGRLMNASHRSLARDFECSTPRLDRMVEYARRAGAFGARLTGAGFGGSIVALCRANDANSVIEALDREYYDRLGIRIPADGSRAILQPADGARVIATRIVW